MMPHVLTGAPEVLMRLAESLRAEVLPRVEESYAVAQIESVALALENLAARVAWAPGLVEAELAAARAVVTELGGVADLEAPAPSPQTDELALLAVAREQAASLAASDSTTVERLAAALDVLADSRGTTRLAGGDLPGRRSDGPASEASQ